MPPDCFRNVVKFNWPEIHKLITDIQAVKIIVPNYRDARIAQIVAVKMLRHHYHDPLIHASRQGNCVYIWRSPTKDTTAKLVETIPAKLGMPPFSLLLRGIKRFKWGEIRTALDKTGAIKIPVSSWKEGRSVQNGALAVLRKRNNDPTIHASNKGNYVYVWKE